MSFEQKKAFGDIAESDIGRWIRSRGNCVLPVYEIEMQRGKGPRFFTPSGELVAPDMFILPAGEWIEAKHKSHFTWHRISRRWVTGVNLHHYQGYQETQALSQRRVWLLFLHRSSIPDQRDIEAGAPTECPTGLFGNNLSFLVEHENHRHSDGGPHGMVYWAAETLKELATLDDLDAVQGGEFSRRRDNSSWFRPQLDLTATGERPCAW